MRLIDWLLVIIPIAFVLGGPVYTRRFVKSVADFLDFTVRHNSGAPGGAAEYSYEILLVVARKR